MSDDGNYHPLFVKGVEYFNECEFYESHEVWEELWADDQGPSRKFLQGLIQAAVALHHFGNGNVRGAKKLYFSSRSYLDPYRPLFRGIDLQKFFADFEACFAPLLTSDDELPQVEIDPDLIPEIHLDPAPQ